MGSKTAVVSTAPRRRLLSRVGSSSRYRIVLIVVAVLVLVHLLFRPTASTSEPSQKTAQQQQQQAREPKGGSWLGGVFGGNHKAKQACSQLLVPESHWDAAEAFVEMPAAGGGRWVSAGESVCVRAVVPARPHNASMLFMPFPGTPWDSVLLDLVGQNTGISVPVQLQLSNDARNYDRGQTHVYEANVVLRDPDVYRAEGYIEYRNAEWNPELPLKPVRYVPEPLRISSTDCQVAVRSSKEAEDRYSLERYLELPLCTRADAEGRWVRASDLPFSASLVPKPDNRGLVWLPYTCRLRPVAYGDFVKCLSQKYPTVHWFGDSNSRRALKKITTLGQWCATPEEAATRACLCEDMQEEFKRFHHNAKDIVIHLDDRVGGFSHVSDADFHAQNIGLHGKSANNARVYFHKWEGLTVLNEPGWNMTFEQGSYREQFAGVPQLVIVALTNWDVAFSTLPSFASQIEILLDYIERVYSKDTRVVIRTGQYHCCSADMTEWHRRFSRLRNKTFDGYLVRVFRDRLVPKGWSVALWDVAAMSEARPFVARNETSTCGSNHARSELIEIENQILFNSLCN